MKKANNIKHIVATELDCAKECNLINIVGEKDILLDIKALLSGYYMATFMAESDCLKVSFNNGQSFKLSVAEI